MRGECKHRLPPSGVLRTFCRPLQSSRPALRWINEPHQRLALLHRLARSRVRSAPSTHPLTSVPPDCKDQVARQNRTRVCPVAFDCVEAAAASRVRSARARHAYYIARASARPLTRRLWRVTGSVEEAVDGGDWQRIDADLLTQLSCILVCIECAM